LKHSLELVLQLKPMSLILMQEMTCPLGIVVLAWQCMPGPTEPTSHCARRHTMKQIHRMANMLFANECRQSVQLVILTKEFLLDLVKKQGLACHCRCDLHPTTAQQKHTANEGTKQTISK